MKSVADTMELLMFTGACKLYLNMEKSEELLPLYSEILAMLTGMF